MHFTGRDEYCDKCLMAFGNDMTYEQCGPVLWFHTHGTVSVGSRVSVHHCAACNEISARMHLTETL